MFPVLLSVGNIPISTFGVFLTLGFLTGLFLIWRLARAWDLDEEKILDLTLVSFLGGLIGSRIYFVLQNFESFASDLSKIILFNKMPGFSFWGAILTSALTLYFFSKKRKMDFWLVSDIAAIGFLGGLILTNLGCFFGGCSLGIVSKLPIAFEMVGQVGRRFPVQILEALFLFIILRNLWSQTTRFHLSGKILSLSLIYIGIIKLLMEPLKASHDEGIYLSGGLIILGLQIFYKITKRSILLDVKGLFKAILRLFTSQSARKHVLVLIRKYWYNRKTESLWAFRNFKKGLKRLNVRFSFKNN